jgi:hypothetical protein
MRDCEYRSVNKTVHMILSFHHVIVLCIVKCITCEFMQDGKKIRTTGIFMLISVISYVGLH